MKSTMERPVENVTISNCIISSHCNAIKCGTESTGGFKNITISNCIVQPSVVTDSVIYGSVEGNSGITLATVDSGTLDGIVISNIRIHGPKVPIFMRLGNRARPYSKNQGPVSVGSFQNVRLSNIVATGASGLGCLIAGIPGHELKNVHLSDISITFKGGGTLADANRSLPENEKKYPDAEQFGMLNAYGFQIRHARNLSLTNIDFQFENDDQRPPLVLEDVDGGVINGLNADVSQDATAYINIRNSGRVDIFNCSPRFEGSAKSFLKVESAENCFININGNMTDDFQNENIIPDTLKYRIRGIK
jgi:hypothetical protein